MDDEYIKEKLERALWFIANYLRCGDDMGYLAQSMLDGDYGELEKLEEFYAKQIQDKH